MGDKTMAYMDFAGHRSAALQLEPFMPPARVREGQATTFTHREWTIVRLAREDGLSSIRGEGRLGRLIRAIFGVQKKNPLSDSRLEALRRMSVLSWHHGYNVAPSEIGGFIDAGYSERQYEVLVEGIVAERGAPRGRN